ncbi:TPA: hypothetical protein O4G77_004302 [Vibrio alginolyticus]|nr:hypothetical protein [Vibrio alginolyticus]
MNKPLNFSEFIAKYQNLRNEVYASVPIATNLPQVKLAPINTLAMAAYKRWGNMRTPPNGGWDWSSWVAHYRERHHKRFEAAIWYGSTLCGLCLGKLSEKNVHVRLEILEGSTERAHPLKGRVAYVALTGFELFGYASGAEEVRVIDPVDGAISTYKALGYSLQPASKVNPRFLSKKIGI